MKLKLSTFVIVSVKKSVILGAAGHSRSEWPAESKDPLPA